MVAHIKMPASDLFPIRVSLILSVCAHALVLGLLIFGSTTFFRPAKEPVFFVELALSDHRAVSGPVGMSVKPEGKRPVRLSPFVPLAPEGSAGGEKEERREESEVSRGDREGTSTLAAGGLVASPPGVEATSTGGGTSGKSLPSSGAGSGSAAPMETRFGAFEAPSFIHREMPAYPPLAQRLGKEGKVVLALLIDEQGNLRGVEVIQGADYGFTEAALEAVKKSTFTPARKNGQAVTSRALLVVRFRLD